MSQSYSLKTSEEILEVRIHKFITIVLIYIHTLITDSYFFFHSKLKWKKNRVLRSEQIKAIQEALTGFIIDQVIDRNGK